MTSYGAWQPIDTVPDEIKKNGTHILARDRNGWREMWWVTCGTDYADYWQDEFDSEPAPDVWMPLPLPPVEE